MRRLTERLPHACSYKHWPRAEAVSLTHVHTCVGACVALKSIVSLPRRLATFLSRSWLCGRCYTRRVYYNTPWFLNFFPHLQQLRNEEAKALLYWQWRRSSLRDARRAPTFLQKASELSRRPLRRTKTRVRSASMSALSDTSLLLFWSGELAALTSFAIEAWSRLLPLLARPGRPCVPQERAEPS